MFASRYLKKSWIVVNSPPILNSTLLRMNHRPMKVRACSVDQQGGPNLHFPVTIQYDTIDWLHVSYCSGRMCSCLCSHLSYSSTVLFSDLNQSARCCSRRSIITGSTSNSYFATSFQGKRYVLYAFKVWRRLGMIGLTSRYSSSSEHPPASEESVKHHARISFPQCDVVMAFFHTRNTTY